MSKLRKKSVTALHGLLADAVLHWRDPTLSEPLRRYVLEHGAYHLRAFGDHDGLWQLLRDDTYHRAQVETTEQYEAAYRALYHGLEAHVERDGAAPEDDGRLCWLALQAGEVGEEARRGVSAAFEWMRERPLCDERRVKDALERISVLDAAGFYKAALLLLWIEADRLEALPECERTDRWARRVLDAVEERLPAGGEQIDWSKFLSVDFMAWLVGRILAVCQHLEMAPVAARTSKAQAYVIRVLEPWPGTERIDAPLMQHAIQVAEQITEDHDRAETLAAVASALGRTGDQLRASGIFDQALLVANAIANDRWRAKTLATLGATRAQTGDTQQALSVCEQARMAADAITDDRWKAETLASVASALAQTGQFEQALQVAQTIKEEYRKARGIGAIAAAAAETGDPLRARPVCEQVLLMADGFAADRWKAETFAAVASAFAVTGDIPRAQQLCQRALLLAEALSNDYWMSETIIAVSSALEQTGNPPRTCQLFEQARQLIDTIKDGLLQAKTLAAIASALARTGQFDQALLVAYAITEGAWKAKTLAALARTGDPQRASPACEQALQAAETIATDIVKAEALARVACALAQTGHFERALEVADAITEERWKTEALATIASVFSLTGDVLRARQVFENAILAAYQTAYSLTVDQTETLVAVASAFAQSGQFEQAIHGAEAITIHRWQSKTRKAKTLALIASALAKAHDAGQARQVFEQALRVAESIQENYWKVITLAAIAEAIGDAGDTLRALQVFEQTLQVAQALTDSQSKANCLEDVAIALAKTGQFEQALLVADAIEEDHRKAETLAAVASALARTGQFAHALRVADRITELRLKAGSLAAIASALARTGDTVQVFSLCEQALQVADAAGYAIANVAVATVAAVFAQTGRFERALEVADTLTNDWHITGTLAGIATALAHTGDSPRARQHLQQVLQLADSIKDALLKATTLATVGSVLPEVADPTWGRQLIERAIQVAETIANDQDKTKSLASIASALVKIGNADRFEQLMGRLSASQQVWSDLLPIWRDALRAGAPAPCVLIRRSMRHYPFLNTVAYNGSLSLLLAHIEEKDDEAWMRIIHYCPQLQLDFLLEGYPSSGHV